MHRNQNQNERSKTYECKDGQTQTCCSSGPPFYQLISLVFGLKYAIILHWQLKIENESFARIQNALGSVVYHLVPWYELKVSTSTVLACPKSITKNRSMA